MRSPLPLAAVLTLTATFGIPPALSAEEATEPRVDVRLVTDVATIGPDGAWVGALVTPPEGWHVYWENPGEAGLATAVEFDAGVGASVGPVHYPGPEVFLSPGDVTSYGYHGTTALLARVTPEATGGAAVTITAEISWLACRSVCVPGADTVALEVPRAEGSSRRLEPDPLAGFKGRLPSPWEEHPGAALSWSSDEGGPVVELSLPAASGLYAFPSAALEEAMRGVVVEQRVDASVVRVRLQPGARGDLRLVLGLGDARYLLLPLSPPEPS